MRLMAKVNYGIDAPHVIKNLFMLGTVSMMVAAILATGKFPAITMFKYSFFFLAVSLIIAAILMILYSKFGKAKHRERMLNMHEWRGDEYVLDVGTGSGLLMIGAAKRITTGKSYGIDIFNAFDLSDNTADHTAHNIRMEGVEDKTVLLTENIVKTDFENEFFDVILSNLCLHNIENAKEKELALAEIDRMLKPGGEVIISDFKHTSQYKRFFEESGMKATKSGPYLFTTFPPLTIVKASKPG